MKWLLVFMLVFLTGALTAQTYVVSYRFTIKRGELVYKLTDTLEQIVMPTVFSDHINFEYHGGYYYFQIAKLIHEKSSTYSRRTRGPQSAEVMYGIATFMANPYSIRISEYSSCPSCSTGKAYTTLWIIPMMFHTKSDIENLRAFIFTNDEHIIKQIRNGKQGSVWQSITSTK